MLPCGVVYAVIHLAVIIEHRIGTVIDGHGAIAYTELAKRRAVKYLLTVLTNL